MGIPVLLDRGTPQSQGRDRGHAFLFEVLLLVKVRAIIWENNSKDGYFVPSKSHGDLTGATSPAGVLEYGK